MSKGKYKKPVIYGITIIIMFIVIRCLYVGFYKTKEFTKDVHNSSLGFLGWANTISIKGSGDGILVNIFGHAITFKAVESTLGIKFSKLKHIKLIGKALCFFVKIIVDSILNIINTCIFK